MTDWHPFKVGMTADHALDIIKRRRYRYVAQNEIVKASLGRMTVKWHLEPCTLVMAFDPQNPPYRIREILDPMETNEYLTRSQAALSAEEIEARTAELEATD